MRNYYCFLGSALGFGKPWSLTYSSLSRQSSKVNFQLCSRLREAVGMGSGCGVRMWKVNRKYVLT